MPGFPVEEPGAFEVAVRAALAVGVESAVLFFMLAFLLHLLRRITDLTFPDGPTFYRNVLIMALAAPVLWTVPFVGWVLALVAVAALTMRFFDGDVLAGFYVAAALWGTHALLGLVLLAHIRGGR